MKLTRHCTLSLSFAIAVTVTFVGDDEGAEILKSLYIVNKPFVQQKMKQVEKQDV